MSYTFTFRMDTGEVLQFPVSPNSIETGVSSRNQTVRLIDGTEINILKKPGLKEIRFKALLPAKKYAFTRYRNGVFQSPYEIMKVLEKLQKEHVPFQFTITRKTPKGAKMYNNSIKVGLETLKLVESSENGQDWVVHIGLKQYVGYGLKTTSKSPGKEPNTRKTEIIIPKTYTVVKGDTLWSIAKKQLGDGSKWKKIYEANKSKIKNPNLIYVGQVFTLT